jgi:hypothetical protein
MDPVLIVEVAGWAQGRCGTWVKFCDKMLSDLNESDIPFVLFVFLSLAN